MALFSLSLEASTLPQQKGHTVLSIVILFKSIAFKTLLSKDIISDLIKN
jgi:hypothetical protein